MEKSGSANQSKHHLREGRHWGSVSFQTANHHIRAGQAANHSRVTAQAANQTSIPQKESRH